MTTLPDVERVIFQRGLWGRSYRDPSLESKRRSAILWLRNCSKRGWCVDKVVRRRA